MLYNVNYEYVLFGIVCKMCHKNLCCISSIFIDFTVFVIFFRLWHGDPIFWRLCDYYNSTCLSFSVAVDSQVRHYWLERIRVKKTELAVVKGNSIKQLKATNWSLKRLLLCNTKNQKAKSKRERESAPQCGDFLPWKAGKKTVSPLQK